MLFVEIVISRVHLSVSINRQQTKQTPTDD